VAGELCYDDYLSCQHPYPAHRPGRPYYLSGVHSAGLTRLAASGADVGLILNPASGIERHLEHYRRFAADNGCFGQGASFDLATWLGWLDSLPRTGCLFVVAPDVFDPGTGRGDAGATWQRSFDAFAKVRALGFPVALALQDGVESHVETWDAIDAWDCAFIAGSTEWKLSGDARDCIHEAALLHKWVHVGRVNSLTRIRRFSHSEVDSVDGTYLKHGPDINLAHLGRWLDDLATELPLWRDYHPLASAENGESRHPSFPLKVLSG
jgi:hypothetical protein